MFIKCYKVVTESNRKKFFLVLDKISVESHGFVELKNLIIRKISLANI